MLNSPTSFFVFFAFLSIIWSPASLVTTRELGGTLWGVAVTTFAHGRLAEGSFEGQAEAAGVCCSLGEKFRWPTSMLPQSEVMHR